METINLSPMVVGEDIKIADNGDRLLTRKGFNRIVKELGTDMIYKIPLFGRGEIVANGLSFYEELQRIGFYWNGDLVAFVYTANVF